MQIIIITGLSGAGKSKALDSFESLGYYCIDNFPPSFIDDFVSLGKDEVEKAAFVMDVRGGGLFRNFEEEVNSLKAQNVDIKLLFLDASNEALIKRYKETRREHPIGEGRSIEESVEREREILSSIKEMADYVIDTSSLKVTDLKNELKKIRDSKESIEKITINVFSFGYKHGVPREADMIFDMRFIPNPFYIQSLKNLTGNNKKVRNYVMKWEESQEFKKRVFDLILYLIPKYMEQGKSSLVIGFGCTGGQHRSVTFANVFYDALSEVGKRVTIRHRDL